MKVAIGIPCGEIARYSAFYDSLLHVKLPPEHEFHKIVIQGRSANVCENRNGIAERAIAMGFDAVWYVDDDQIFAPDTLLKLVAHDKDIISGLYLRREPPFQPVIYERENQYGHCYPRLLKSGEAGLIQVIATGAGCFLVKTAVLKKMEKPWWRLGQITKDGWGDDLNFCHRARREAKAEIWCDLDIFVGHCMSGVIWPMRQNQEWSTILVQAHDPIASWPAAQPSPFMELKK